MIRAQRKGAQKVHRLIRSLALVLSLYAPTYLEMPASGRIR